MRRKPSSALEGEAEPSVNLTPLIDVVFVILITFILIAPLTEIDQISLAQAPQIPSAKAMEEKSPIRIYLQKNDQIFWQQQPVNSAELRLFLIQARQQHPEAIPQLFPDKSVHFGTYQAVKNAVEEAGFSQMDIVLKSG